VAPNEDAEGAILRMFARLRAPRVERAEIAWAATPAWTTPLPSALFGGETVHAFAGFASVPAGMATLKLVPRGEAAPLTAQASLPTTLVVDRTLARVAAARRIETATEAEQLKLALDYGLLTARTNLLVVHERAEGEKAKDLPELAHVAQMHAAGWHGVGSVRDLMFTDVHACSHMVTADISFASEDQTAVLRRPSSLFSVSERHLGKYVHFGDAATDDLGDDGSATGFESRQSLDRLLAAIESAGPGHRPATLGDLAAAGLPHGLLTVLEDLVRAGHDEKDVVRALLEALGAMLADGSIKARTSRHFARTLRRQFARDDEARELRRAVRASVETEARAVA
jgi:Ca-activated chloride channel family protein